LTYDASPPSARWFGVSLRYVIGCKAPSSALVKVESIVMQSLKDSEHTKDGYA
jgi:hypothetical protein